jgi:iron uptake system component EfeO
VKGASLPGVLTAGALVALAGCTSNETTADNAIAVTSSDTACEVSSGQAPSGTLTFNVTNAGAQVTEFYLLAEDGLRILGEVENIGPGLRRDLVLAVPPGKYLTACKPGMTGDGIQAEFTITDSGADLAATGQFAEQIQQAADTYAFYVKDQAEQLVADTDDFVEAYLAGDDDRARALYAPTRMHWERIEPVAESFGDLDPKLDLREADLEEGQDWTGWHRIEKDLWPPVDYRPMSPAQRQKISKLLVADTATLLSRVADQTYRADQLGNGAKELLDEVATGKVTGEEEAWSHTDLWDFQANVDGARVAFDALAPVVQGKDPELAQMLESRFDDVQAALDQHRKGDGFVLYTDLSPNQVKRLAASVDALAEPLSQLTATVVT